MNDGYIQGKWEGVRKRKMIRIRFRLFVANMKVIEEKNSYHISFGLVVVAVYICI